MLRRRLRGGVEGEGGGGCGFDAWLGLMVSVPKRIDGRYTFDIAGTVTRSYQSMSFVRSFRLRCGVMRSVHLVITSPADRTSNEMPGPQHLYTSLLLPAIS